MNTFVVIRRKRFVLDLYERRVLSRTWQHIDRYSIAVGMEGHETEPDLYEVQHMSRHPAYVYPDSQWVRDMGIEPGTKILPDDPANPVAPRWIGFSDYQQLGIHGTNRPESIGTRASHGCIRLLPTDVIALYRKVRRGTPVFVY